jgi:hypothetical protein
MKVRAVFVVVLATSLLAACGNQVNSATNGQDRDKERIKPFDVVALQPDAGSGVVVAIAGARIVADGSLQLLVEGGSCARPTRLTVQERHDSVVVKVYAADVSGGGACTEEIVPWFLPVDLSSDLGDRSLIDGKAKEVVRVADCAADAADPWCQYPSR